MGGGEKWKKRNVFVYEILALLKKNKTKNQSLQEPVCLLCNVTAAACVWEVDGGSAPAARWLETSAEVVCVVRRLFLE